MTPRRTMHAIAAEVASERGLTVAQLRGPYRMHWIAHPRQEAMWRIRQEALADASPAYSLTQIGRFFGRNHATVIHGIRRHEERALCRRPEFVKPLLGCVKLDSASEMEPASL